MTFLADLLKFLGVVVGIQVVIWGILQLVWKFSGRKIVELQTFMYGAEEEYERYKQDVQ